MSKKKTWSQPWHLQVALTSLPLLRTPDFHNDDHEDDADDDHDYDHDEAGDDVDENNCNLLLNKKVDLPLSPSSHPRSVFAKIPRRDVS